MLKMLSPNQTAAILTAGQPTLSTPGWIYFIESVSKTNATAIHSKTNQKREVRSATFVFVPCIYPPTAESPYSQNIKPPIPPAIPPTSAPARQPARPPAIPPPRAPPRAHLPTHPQYSPNGSVKAAGQFLR